MKNCIKICDTFQFFMNLCFNETWREFSWKIPDLWLLLKHRLTDSTQDSSLPSHTNVRHIVMIYVIVTDIRYKYFMFSVIDNESQECAHRLESLRFNAQGKAPEWLCMGININKSFDYVGLYWITQWYIK